METGKFAFCIHPITYHDISRKYAILGKMPNPMVKKTLKWLPPSKVSQITGISSTYGEAMGWFVGIPLLSEQMIGLPESFVIRKIIKAGKIAESLGAKILGLGAFTSIVGDGGITVSKNLNIAVTTGNSYTVATALEAVEEACAIMGKDMKKCSAVVIGATGSIGRVCALLIAQKVDTLTLTARSIEKLEKVAQEILRMMNRNVRIEPDIMKALKNTDIVVTVSSAVDSIIKPEYLKIGAIVCDVARPRDVSKEVFEHRKDVLVIEGGVVEVPGDVNFGFNFGFPNKLSYACMAETMILALEKRYEDFSIGRKLSLEKVIMISKLAKKHGFKLAGLRSFDKVVENHYFNEIKENIHKAYQRNHEKIV